VVGEDWASVLWSKGDDPSLSSCGRIAWQQKTEIAVASWSQLGKDFIRICCILDSLCYNN
jgi:hypothetical protein